MFAEFLRRCVGVVLLAGMLVAPASAQNATDAPETETPATASNTDAGPTDRIAFVVGVGAYAQKPIAHALNDAGLVAEALRSIGFEVVEAADPNQADFLRSYREFLDKVTEAGPEAVAFVYFSGYGFAFEGDNYLALSDAKIERVSDISLGTVRLSDLVRPLAATPARAKLMALDAARPLPFTIPDRPLPKGLAVPVPEAGMLIGYSSAPGTVAEDGSGDYGPYATAIAEMVRTPGLDLNSLFTQIRVRTHQATEGKQTPFHVTALKDTAPLVEKEDDKPSDDSATPPQQAVAEDDAKPLKEVGPEKAYARTIRQDTLEGYDEYAEAYPDSPYVARIRALARARREALLWIRALEENTPEAYWTYLQRYPDGMYAADAEYRLRRLQAREEPPQDFTPVEFADVPLPPPWEPEEIFDVIPAAPPPPPVFLIAPPPRIFINLRPPRRIRPGVLPVTIRLPGVRPPRRPPRVGIRPPRPPRVGIRPPGGPGVRPPGAIGRLPRPPGARPPGVRRPPGARPPGQVRRPPGARPPGQVRRPPPQVRRPPPQQVRRPPPQVRRPPPQVRRPPPPQVRRPPPQVRRPPPQVRRPPPQQVRRPPPQVRRPPPQVRRPPPQVRRPPPQVRRPPPQQVRRPAPQVRRPAPARQPACRIVNGRRVCR